MAVCLDNYYLMKIIIIRDSFSSLEITESTEFTILIVAQGFLSVKPQSLQIFIKGLLYIVRD
jgi:hypothetical protein